MRLRCGWCLESLYPAFGCLVHFDTGHSHWHSRAVILCPWLAMRTDLQLPLCRGESGRGSGVLSDHDCDDASLVLPSGLVAQCRLLNLVVAPGEVPVPYNLSGTCAFSAQAVCLF